jgi:hypothetical protein
MANTKEFQAWHRMEVARVTGELGKIEQEVQKQMNNIKVEIKQDGIWVEVDKNDELDKGE